MNKIEVGSKWKNSSNKYIEKVLYIGTSRVFCIDQDGIEFSHDLEYFKDEHTEIKEKRTVTLYRHLIHSKSHFIDQIHYTNWSNNPDDCNIGNYKVLKTEERVIELEE